MMTKKMLLAFCLLFFVFIQAASSASGPTNIIINGGFDDSAGEKPSGWLIEVSREGSTQIVTGKRAYAGGNSLEIKANMSCDTRVFQKVNLKPDTYYRFSGWIATENVTMDKTGAVLSIVGGYNHTPSLNGTRGWTYRELNFRTGGSWAEIALAARLGMWSNEVAGTAWFDEINLVELDAPPPSFIQLPGANKPAAAATNGNANNNLKFLWFALILVAIGIQILIFRSGAKKS